MTLEAGAVGLTDIQITKTVEMNVGQLDGLIESDRVTGDAGCGCGEGRVNTHRADLAAACVGKVWSARISASKPM